MKTKVNCASCNKEIEVENWTYGARYWCKECSDKGKVRISVDYDKVDHDWFVDFM